MAAPLISIVAPAVGQVALTRRCVESIKRFTHVAFEVILVSNGSTPGEEAELRKLCGPGQFLRFDSVLGYPRAINEGARRATGEYLCLMNNDAAFTGPWARALIGALAHGDIVSPVVDNIAQPAQRLGTAPGRLSYVPMLFFVCVVMRRELFEERGGLDERYGLGNSEDVAFCRQVTAWGGKLLVEPAVFVTHKGSATFLELLGADGYRELLERNAALREAGME